MPNLKFPKSERLTNKKKFESLFNDGSMVKGFPLKLIYHVADLGPEEELMQIAFTVPKRNFKNAVDRNFLRRKMKEIYRLNRHHISSILEQKQKSFYGIIIYTNREKMDYHAIEKGWKKLLSNLIQDLD